MRVIAGLMFEARNGESCDGDVADFGCSKIRRERTPEYYWVYEFVINIAG